MNLSEDDPTIVSGVLLYQYTRGYDAEEVPRIGSTRAVRDTETIVITTDGCTRNFASTANAVLPKPSYRTKAGLELTIDRAKQHLSVHAEVYACADRLGIEELKEYACIRFVDVAEDEVMKLYVQPFYGELLTFVYANTIMERTEKEEKTSVRTVSTTSGLRYAATMCAVRNLTQAPVASEIEKAIVENEPMAWEVAQVLTKKRTELEDKVKRIDAKFARAITRNSSVHEQLDIANKLVSQKGPEQIAYAKNVVKKLENILNGSTKCTRCKKELKAGTIAMEESQSLPWVTVKVVVTCRGCGTCLPIDVEKRRIV